MQKDTYKYYQALSRLGLNLATATSYLVNTGVAIVATGQCRWIDPHWHRGLSYSQLGGVGRTALDGATDPTIKTHLLESAWTHNRSHPGQNLYIL